MKGEAMRHTAHALVLSAMVAPAGLQAAGDVQAEITGTIRASCTVTSPPLVAVGGIPLAEISLPGSESGLARYAKAFTMGTRCVGTTEYRLTFKAEHVTDSGCADTGAGAMAFCLYHGDRLINLTGREGGSIEGTPAHAEVGISVRPARGSQDAVAGEYSASVTVTVEPQ